MPLIPTYCGAVNAWESDAMGHMNVQFYMGKSMEAMGHLRHALGLAPDRIRARGLTLVPGEDRIRYRRELRAGDIFHMASGVRGLRDGGIDTHTELRNIETGEIAATIDRRLSALDLASGEFLPLPDDLAGAAGRLAEATAADCPPWPAAQGWAAPAFDHPGTTETYRGTFNNWEVDEFGYASPRFHVDRFSAALVQLLARLGFSPENRPEPHWGLAALDHHVRYHAVLRAGALLGVRSGILEIRDKVFRIFHHMEAGASGRPATSIEIVLAMFDLERRRAMPVPDQVRTRAEALLPTGPAG
ncbi:MAG: acyl-ACP thioesterase [Alphaproteobacteria bacterium]|nr:acyl-ACP thioesterase [Alphaproteobacteria bacterium]